MKLATLCYVRQPGMTLMIHRIKNEKDMHLGKWNGLGGKFEPGESPEECALREIYEESGLRIRKLTLKGFLTFPAFDDIDDWYVFVFVGEDFEGDLIDPAEGYLRWIPDAELLKLNLWEGDLIFLPWLEQEGMFSGKFVYEHRSLASHEVVFYP